MNDWNVVCNNIISQIHYTTQSYPRETLCWTGAPILSRTRANTRTTQTTQIWSLLPWVTILLNSFNLDTTTRLTGTPAAWTTNVVGKPAYYSLNVWGPHHWVVLVDMDCSQTQDGWFEFTTVYSLGGAGALSHLLRKIKKKTPKKAARTVKWRSRKAHARGTLVARLPSPPTNTLPGSSTTMHIARQVIW